MYLIIGIASPFAMKVNSCLASSPNLSEPHEMNSGKKRKINFMIPSHFI